MYNWYELTIRAVLDLGDGAGGGEGGGGGESYFDLEDHTLKYYDNVYFFL